MSKDLTTSVFQYGDARGLHKIGLFFRRLKWAWQRAVKGYCDFDLYDLDTYHTNMMIKALREFANKTQSYPTDMDYDDWVRIITEIADCLEQSIEDEDFDTPEYREWRRLTEKYRMCTENADGTITISLPNNEPELDEARKKWLTIIQADQHYRENMKNRAFDLLKQYYWHLWW